MTSKKKTVPESHKVIIHFPPNRSKITPLKMTPPGFEAKSEGLCTVHSCGNRFVFELLR